MFSAHIHLCVDVDIYSVTYVFFNPHSYSHLFNKIDMHTGLEVYFETTQLDYYLNSSSDQITKQYIDYLNKGASKDSKLNDFTASDIISTYVVFEREAREYLFSFNYSEYSLV